MQAGGRYAVTIMASRRNGTLYVGVTNNIELRAYQHRTGAGGERQWKLELMESFNPG